MKDIKAILAEVELDDETKDSIVRAVNENYKTVEEMAKKTKRIEELEKQNETLNEQNAALSEQVGKLEGDSEDIEALKKQIADFERAEESRKATEAENAKREAFLAVFDAAVGEREFANDIIRDSIFEKTYEKCSEQAGLDAKRVIEDLAKDADGVWKNPQNDIKTMPVSANGSEGGEIPVRNLSDVKGMSADDINRNWDTIGKLLANKKG